LTWFEVAKRYVVGKIILTLVLFDRSKKIFTPKKVSLPMNKLALLLVAVFLFVASPAMAENYKAYVNGRDLIERCDTEYNPTSKFVLPNCLGYIAGVIDLHENLVRTEGVKPNFCKPERHDLTEMHRVVCEFLKENPNLLINSASDLVIEALAELFPCSKP
jgi:hypothetical protein